ncbi:hypothetical protein SISNIDRAFT_465862 [Sistotremastrum niveocremeum HHB9708]|uniref:F-box domain-containing protein n=1 Tax=Sistotremastrum niveocremeum HHB9708 TaxID=1314777 RepID=A0A164UZR0_9AGAM|nr:hypothetical protein SISNIDRAFT_465862 [Sistotremastrum niveocremeum HHB9708]
MVLGTMYVVLALRRLSLTQVTSSDRGFRAFVLLEPRCRFIWSTMHLQWPPGAVDLYLRRSQGRPLSVSLIVPKTNASKSKKDRWATFLSTNMCMIRALDISICNRQCSAALSRSLDTPAPILRSFTLNLGHSIDSVQGLFSGFAPGLDSVRINARRSFDLQCFPSIRVLVMRVNPYVHASLLPTLAALSNLEELTLISTIHSKDNASNLYSDRAYCFPETFPETWISLVACRSLTLKHFETPFIEGFLSTVNIQSVKELIIHENMVCGGPKDSFAWLSPTFASPFPYVPLHPIRPTLLRLEIDPNRVYLVADGTPSYTYSLDLRPLCCTGEGFEIEIANILVNLATQLSVQPCELTIVIDAGQSIRVANHALSRLYDAISSAEFWQYVLAAYGAVETICLAGNVTAIVSVLSRVDASFVLPSLSEIRVPENSVNHAVDPACLADLLKTWPTHSESLLGNVAAFCAQVEIKA